MDWGIIFTFFLFELEAVLGFNIDPVAWKSFKNSAAGFGYQVVQRQSDLLVSAPLEQHSSDQRGQIFSCSDKSCQNLQVQVPESAINMSLGLTMTSDPNSDKTLACGPTIPKDCKSITMYSGMCVEIMGKSSLQPPIPSSAEECRTQADIAFLLDGSGSVQPPDFERMKMFVSKMIESLLGKDIQFAIAQFSTQPRVHYHFNTFNPNNWAAQIRSITQFTGWTYTAAAITHVVDNVFIPSSGSRAKVKKVLIVITDGESTDPKYLPGAIQHAESKNILRFAIGVGSAFSRYNALNELQTIASKPKEDFVFKVETFEALDKIRQNLQDKIFSIEGSQTSGASLQLELSQEGFSAAYIIGGIQTAIVGANQWRGGYKRYTGKTFISSYQPMLQVEPDSYLGYSMAMARTADGQLTIIGAPRYQHRGVVIVTLSDVTRQKIEPNQQESQIGEYFGAAVCTMDTNINFDGMTDLIMISAPMYKESDREGRVYVCTLAFLSIDCHFESPLVLKGVASERGRFGSSLAVLPDLNNDGFSDLVVGAPLENDGQGSIYIFHAEGRQRISSAFSQRISASEVQSGLKFFGMSISQSSFDQSGDDLPDLAVGSKGTVLLLRSRPIVIVTTNVSFVPNEIPTLNVDCSKPLENKADICFYMSSHSKVDAAQARINYTLTYDATRRIPNNRAYINDKKREQIGSLILKLETPVCNHVKFFTEACPDDIINPLENELTFTFDGLPSDTNLKPSLAQQTQKSTYPLRFEINCGTDEKCVDDLKVDFNFSRSSEVVVGVDEVLEVTVSLKNRGENSYNTHIILTYPPGLSYRKVTAMQGRIQCNSLDSQDSVTEGKTDCTVDKPVFKGISEAVFVVTYGIGANSQIGRKIVVTANAISGNQHSPSSELNKMKEVDVKYNIFVSVQSNLNYCNFTFGSSNLQKPVEQLIKVTNSIRAFSFTVVIRVPIKLGNKEIWVNSTNLQIEECQHDKDEEPAVDDVIAKIKKNAILDCSVAQCRVFRCSRYMRRLETKTYAISANLSSAWIEQIGLPSAKFSLTSTVTVEYDNNQYIFYSPSSNNSLPAYKVNTEVEVYPLPNFTKEIIGGSLGGLAFLALLTAGLYKAGFFKSKYGKMINQEGEGSAQQTDGGTPT